MILFLSPFIEAIIHSKGMRDSDFIISERTVLCSVMHTLSLLIAQHGTTPEYGKDRLSTGSPTCSFKRKRQSIVVGEV